MTQLTFSGRSDDGKRLRLVDGEGREYTLALDGRLRRAVGSEPDTTGQLEIQMESTLRPRDIQARIRAGESPEAVARAAGSTVDKIMPFAAPVMAERAHVAQRAQLSSVRRRSESGARTLGEAVASHLRSLNTDPGTVEWDAWRREDGRWTLTGAWTDAGAERTGTFSFDQRGNYVTIDDDDARWLVGDAMPADDAPAAAAGEAALETGPESADELSAARQRRLSAVSADELPLGDDAIELVAEPDPPAAAEPTAAETTLELDGVSADQPLEAFLEDAAPGTHAQSADDTAHGDTAEPAGATEATGKTTADADAADADAADAADPDEQPARRPRKRGRASVPSWDEIMFGGGKGD